MTLASIPLLVLTESHASQPQKLPVKDFKVCGKDVALEVADHPEARRTGLMFRTGLPAGKGMLFVFPRPEIQAFWMHNVPFDIDIGYFDSKGTLVSFHTMAGTSAIQSPESLKTYSSQRPAVFAVELPPGFFKSQNLGTNLAKCRLRPIPPLPAI